MWRCVRFKLSLWSALLRSTPGYCEPAKFCTIQSRQLFPELLSVSWCPGSPPACRCTSGWPHSSGLSLLCSQSRGEGCVHRSQPPSGPKTIQEWNGRFRWSWSAKDVEDSVESRIGVFCKIINGQGLDWIPNRNDLDAYFQLRRSILTNSPGLVGHIAD